MGHPAADQGSSTGGSVCLSKRNGLGPESEAIHDGEEMGVALGCGERAHQVNVQVVKAPARDWNVCERSVDVSLNLGVLAGEALLGPLADLLVQAVPDKLGGHQPAGGVDAGVREVVDSVKHFAAPGHWHHRVLAASGDVTQEFASCRAHWDVLEAQGGDGRAVGVDLRVCLLGLRHLLKVESILDGTDDCTRERVCHWVVLAGDVLQVGGVLRDEAEVALLTLRPGVGNAAESEHEGLLVGEHSEVPALEVVAELLDDEVDRQKLAVKGAVLDLRRADLLAEESKRLPDLTDVLLKNDSHRHVRGIGGQGDLCRRLWMAQHGGLGQSSFGGVEGDHHLLRPLEGALLSFAGESLVERAQDPGSGG